VPRGHNEIVEYKRFPKDAACSRAQRRRGSIDISPRIFKNVPFQDQQDNSALRVERWNSTDRIESIRITTRVVSELKLNSLLFGLMESRIECNLLTRNAFSS